MQFSDGKELKHAVQFIENRKEPIHNWYWYKEGFSKSLVDFMLAKLGITNEHVVFDPFCGVGTTLLACKQAGIPSMGIDISPLAVLASKVKTSDHDLNFLEASVKEALSWKPHRVPVPKDSYLRKAFSRYALEDLVFLREKIAGVTDENVKDFLTLALIDSSLKGSFMVKDGALVRVEKRGTIPVGKFFKYKIRKMLHDLKKNNLPKVPVSVIEGDAREMRQVADESIDFVITSPPYLNKIEYSKIYKFELNFFFGLPASQIRNYIGTGIEGDVEKDYWNGISQVFSELKRVCKPNAKIAWIVGGGCFPDKVVEVDVETAKIAEQFGFNNLDVLVARTSWCTARRTIKVGQMRESALILEKV